MIDLKIWNVSNKLSPNYSHEPNPLSKHESQMKRFYFFSKNKLGILHSGYTKPEKNRNFAEMPKPKKISSLTYNSNKRCTILTPTKGWL